MGRERGAAVLIAVWLLRMRPGLRSPDRIRCNDHADRKRIFVEQQEQYPGAEFLEVDVYRDGTIHVCAPSTETP